MQIFRKLNEDSFIILPETTEEHNNFNKIIDEYKTDEIEAILDELRTSETDENATVNFGKKSWAEIYNNTWLAEIGINIIYLDKVDLTENEIVFIKNFKEKVIYSTLKRILKNTK